VEPCCSAAVPRRRSTRRRLLVVSEVLRQQSATAARRPPAWMTLACRHEAAPLHISVCRANHRPHIMAFTCRERAVRQLSAFAARTTARISWH